LSDLQALALPEAASPFAGELHIQFPRQTFRVRGHLPAFLRTYHERF
jgi:hypothetical protein